MSLRKDRAAIIEMPFKLLIAIMIMAVTAAAGFGALSSYSKTMLENDLRQEAQTVASAAQRLDTMDLESSLKIQISIENTPMDHMEYFKIGYPLSTPVHPYSAMVRYKGAGSGEGHVTVRDNGDNYLPMCSPSGETLSLGVGSHGLLLTKLYSDACKTVFIKVERTD
jgi:type II secretory pathway pseudopilin PulG